MAATVYCLSTLAMMGCSAGNFHGYGPVQWAMGIRAFGSQPDSCFWCATGNPCVVANMKPANSSPPCGRFETPTPSYLLMGPLESRFAPFPKSPKPWPTDRLPCCPPFRPSAVYPHVLMYCEISH